MPLSLSIPAMILQLILISITISDPECSVMKDFFAFDIEDHSNSFLQSIISTAATSLRETSTFVIDPFLSSKGLERLQSDILSVPYNHQHIYRSVFQDLGDLSTFPDGDHPRNRVGFVSLGHTNRNDLPDSFEHLYAFPPLLSLLRAIVAESGIYEQVKEQQDGSLYLSQDTEGAIYSLFAEGGDHGSWHYDQHPFSCVWMIQKPQSGGVLEIIQLDPTDIDESYWKSLQMVWDKEDDIQHSIRSVEANEGGMYCFAGNTSLHQVTKVQGKRLRAVIVMAYATETNFKHSQDISDINFADGIDKVVDPKHVYHQK